MKSKENINAVCFWPKCVGTRMRQQVCEGDVSLLPQQAAANFCPFSALFRDLFK